MNILLSGSPGELRFSLMQGGEILDIALWHPGNPDGWGDHYNVRVLSKVPSFDGVFVQLNSRLNGFLTTNKTLQEGQLVKAQIIRAAQNNKGPRLKLLSNECDEKPAHIGLLQAGPHPLESLLAQAPQASLCFEDASLAAQLPAKYQPRFKRLIGENFAFLDEEWATLLESSVQVGPLTAHISVTPALTAIDLDASANPDFAANCEAFEPLMRQIRLRNLSGTIVIDPAGIRTRKRAALIPFLEHSLQNVKDSLKPKITGLTPSGLIEMTRPRQRPPIQEVLSSPYGQGVSILRHILRENLQGDVLHAPASIIQALGSDLETIKSFETERGKKLHLSVCTSHNSKPWTLS